MTLFVLGAGFHCAQTKISNSLLHELNPDLAMQDLERELGIFSRCSSLPEQYLRDNGETSSAAVKSAALESPSELAFRASLQALNRAGVSPAQLGLIMCDCGTPYEVIPAESQRIGEKFRLKVPSYDLTATTGPIPAQFEALDNWRPDRVPEYTLLSATNTPTHWINVRSGLAPYIFGDGAGALVVSSRHSGKLALVKAALYSGPTLAPVVSFDLYQHGVYTRESEAVLYELATRAAHDAFAEVGSSRTNVKFIGPQWNVAADKKLAGAFGVLPQNIWSSVARYGNSLGALPVVTLAEQWDAIQPGDRIVCVQVGASLSYGYAIFEAAQ